MDVLESKTGTRKERDSDLQTNVGLRQGSWKNAQRATGLPSVKESTCIRASDGRKGGKAAQLSGVRKNAVKVRLFGHSSGAAGERREPERR